MSSKTSHKRLAYLETARGVASIIVVLHHFMLGFFASLKEPFLHGGIKNTPFYILINGSGAVAFFFMLSGFVLTNKFYHRFSWAEFLTAVIKRLPRLMLPVGLSLVCGAAVLKLIPAAHVAAAKLTGSDWLADFGGANFSPGFVPSFRSAVLDAALVFLLPNHFQYNSNLWTMFYEFYGSLEAFALAAIATTLLHARHLAVILLHVAVILISISNPFFMPFAIGSLISYLHAQYATRLRLPVWAIVVLTLVILKGFSIDSRNAVVVASSAMMVILLGVPSLEYRLGSSFGLFLGRLSFPLYLVHVLVILSVTSEVYAFLESNGITRSVALAVCFMLTWIVSLIAALPILRIEQVWIPIVSRYSASLTGRVARLGGHERKSL